MNLKYTCLLLVCLTYINCKEQAPKYVSIDKVYEWYYDQECINETIDSAGNVIPRDADEKNFLIDVQKILLHLDSDWNFFNQEIHIYELSETEYQIKTELTFQFKNQSRNIIILDKTFYYDLESVVPIPIKQYTIHAADESIDIQDRKYLWYGDYNDYMKFYFELETRRLDSL